MMTKFEVSDEFKMFQAQTTNAFKEAGQAEHGTEGGCDMPTGTTGRGCLAGGVAEKTPSTTKDNQNIPGKPRFRMEIEVLEPESHKGRKYSRVFNLDNHPNFSTQQKLAQWWDFMEDAGCPREVRTTGDPAQAFAWAAQGVRSFNFIVVENKGYKNIKPVPPLGPMPTASATDAAMAANQAPTVPTLPQGVAVGGMCKAFEQILKLESVDGHFCTLVNPANGQRMEKVALTQLQSL